MHSLATETDVRAMHVAVEEARLVVDLMDGRTIAVPLASVPATCQRHARATQPLGTRPGAAMESTGPTLMKT